MFVLELTVLSSNITGALNFVSMNNQICKVRPKIADINSNNPIIPSDISDGIDVNRSDESKECTLCHYLYFLDKIFS